MTPTDHDHHRESETPVSTTTKAPLTEAQHVAACEAAGRQAHALGGMRAPILYPAYCTAIRDLPVGDPRTRTYAAAFQRGYDAAAQDAALAEPAPVPAPTCALCTIPLTYAPDHPGREVGDWYVHPPTPEAPNAPVSGIGHTLACVMHR